MGIEEQILDYQLSNGVFDDATFAGTVGIAKRAVAEGFDTLSVKQRSVLEPYLSQACSGVTDPGGYHKECPVILEGQALLDAYHRCEDTGSLVCESCNDDEEYYAYQWDKISRE